MTIKIKNTRFRAYQLGNAGSSFSYFDGDFFTLIEARLTELNSVSIDAELKECGLSYINALHITSWDLDHCSPKQLEQILVKYCPSKIEYPGYHPHTDAGEESLKIIKAYKKRQSISDAKIISVTPAYIKTLNSAENYGYNDIIYHPRFLDDTSSNDNSTVKHFRSGSFNVLSLGDVESNNIAAGLRRLSTINKEVDVMILAHHGADNGFTTSSFIKSVRPKIAIATANYDNKFDHPRQEIRDLLYEHDVKIFTTKTGDVIVKSIKGHKGHYKVENLISNSTNISSEYEFFAKKSDFLKNNQDAIRNMLNRKKWP